MAVARKPLQKQKQDLTEGRLAALGDIISTGWSAAGRKNALDRLVQAGLPHPRDEYWKFTRPEALTRVEPEKAAIFTSDDAEIFEDLDRIKIVFVDGVFNAAESDDLTLSGVKIDRLADASGADIHWAQGLYGTLEERGQDPVSRPLAAMNTAYASDGVLIHVTGKAAQPISLIYHPTSVSADSLFHMVN